jgi:hypothetical protein
MTTATVNFGCATFTNSRETERLSCSLVASLQGELEAIDNGTISARILHQQKQWTRCRTPFPFRVSFSFDCLFQFAPEDKALIKQAVADKILSKSVCRLLHACCDTDRPSYGHVLVWFRQAAIMRTISAPPAGPGCLSLLFGSSFLPMPCLLKTANDGDVFLVHV